MDSTDWCNSKKKTGQSLVVSNCPNILKSFLGQQIWHWWSNSTRICVLSQIAQKSYNLDVACINGANKREPKIGPCGLSWFCDLKVRVLVFSPESAILLVSFENYDLFHLTLFFHLQTLKSWAASSNLTVYDQHASAHIRLAKNKYFFTCLQYQVSLTDVVRFITQCFCGEKCRVMTVTTASKETIVSELARGSGD